MGHDECGDAGAGYGDAAGRGQGARKWGARWGRQCQQDHLQMMLRYELRNADGLSRDAGVARGLAGRGCCNGT